MPADPPDGFTVERRWFLQLPLLAAAGALAAQGTKLESLVEPLIPSAAGAGMLDFPAFVKACGELAARAHRDAAPLEEAHVARIIEAAVRLKRDTVPAGRLFPYGGFVDIGPLAKAPALSVILWRLAPGTIFPPHDHDPVDVVTLCLEGGCRVRHFEIEGPSKPHESREAFNLRLTLDLQMTPGRCSSLTRHRDYIHTFQAGPQGVLALDINTSLPGKGTFSFLDIQKEALDAERRLYKATWKTL